MSVLFLSGDSGIPVRGNKGASVHVRMMCRAFSRLGYPVRLVTPRPGPAAGVPVEAVTVAVPPDSANVPTEQKLVETAAAQLEGDGFDFVYERFSLWSSAGSQLRRAHGLPFVLEVNAPLRVEAERYRQVADPELARAVERKQFSTADLISVVSKPLADYVVKHGASPDRVVVLPNGVDPDMFNPGVRGGPVHARYGLHGKFVIGFAGRIRPWHDIETLLTAFAELFKRDDSYHLLVVGQYPQTLLERISALELTAAVTLTGPIEHTEMPAHLAAMHVAVAPYADQEGFYFSPLKLYEYLATGTPTVAARIGQIARVVRHGENGLLYAPGDGTALATAITELRERAAWRRALAWQGAVDVLQNNTWEQNAATLLSKIGLPAAGNAARFKPLLDETLRRRLYRATDLRRAAQIFKRTLPQYSDLGPERLKRIAGIEILKYKPGRRCVIGYRLKARDKATAAPRYAHLVGKVFRDDRGRRLHSLQKQLYECGFGPDATDQIFVPESVAYVSSMRMHVQRWMKGQTLDQLALRRKIQPYMPRAGQALAKLHHSLSLMPSAQRKLLKPFRLEHELESVAATHAAIIALRPDRKNKLTEIFESIISDGKLLNEAAADALLHRDFYYSQLLLSRESVTLIDFDLLAVGDPAIDVANFTAHLMYLGLEQHNDFYRFQPAKELFEASYRASAAVDSQFMSRVRFFERTTWFRLLRVVSGRSDKAYLFDQLFPVVLTSQRAVPV